MTRGPSRRRARSSARSAFRSAVAALGILSVACTGAATTTVTREPITRTATATQTPSAFPSPPHVTDLRALPPGHPPAQKPRLTTQGGVMLWRAWPNSGLVEPGIGYRYSLATHCGITAFVDFDGTFWDFVGPQNSNGDPPALDRPTDTGVIVLVGPERAAFMTEAGAWLWFSRHQGPQAATSAMSREAFEAPGRGPRAGGPRVRSARP